MILDPETLDLVDAIERLIGEDDGGAVKPELHQCVLEIATRAGRRHARGGRGAARPAAGGPQPRGIRGADHLLGRHAPVRALGGPPDLGATSATAT